MFRAKRVKLLADLTSYDRRCKMGSLGWTLPDRNAQWGVIVRYDSGAELDTLWRSLEVLEAETRQGEIESLRREFEHNVDELLRLGANPADLRKLITEKATIAKTRLGKALKKEAVKVAT